MARKNEDTILLRADTARKLTEYRERAFNTAFRSIMEKQLLNMSIFDIAQKFFDAGYFNAMCETAIDNELFDLAIKIIEESGKQLNK